MTSRDTVSDITGTRQRVQGMQEEGGGSSPGAGNIMTWAQRRLWLKS